MKRSVIAVLLVGGALAASLALGQMGVRGPGGMMGPGAGGPGGMMGWNGGAGPGGMMGGGGGSYLRHRYVMTNGIDPAYASARNPLEPTCANLAEGKSLFEQNCAACHGESGRGDGPAAKGLTPPPADIAAAVRMPLASDAYLDWTISEGGVPLKSAMPPFKSALSSDKIWKVILYLRTL